MAHKRGKVLGQQAFRVHKKGSQGPRGPFLGKRFLNAGGEAMEEDTLWWGTETWVPAQESDTEHFRPGFYRVDRRLSGSLSVPVLSLSNH